MSHSHAGGSAQGVLVGAMWSYAANVLRPAQVLKRRGLLDTEVVGEEPTGVPRKGLGAYFSRRSEQPVLLAHATEHDHLVDEFDRMAEVYAAFVRPFSGPIFEEALSVIGR